MVFVGMCGVTLYCGNAMDALLSKMKTFQCGVGVVCSAILSCGIAIVDLKQKQSKPSGVVM